MDFAIDRDGLPDRVEKFLSNTLRFVNGMYIFKHHDELVATHACNGICAAKRSSKAICDGNKYRISGMVTYGVVNALEIVQVHH